MRAKEEMEIPVIPAGFAYSEELVDFILEDAKKSNIVLKQQASDYNVLTGEIFDMKNSDDVKKKEAILSVLGGYRYSIDDFNLSNKF